MPGGHVARHGSAGADVGIVADGDRRHELCVAADLHPAADDRAMLRKAVVVAGNRPGADVGRVADLAVAEVREVVRLRAASDARFLRLDEVADVDLGRELGAGPEVREGTDHRIVADAALGHDRPEPHVHAVAELGVAQQDRSVEPARAADAGATEQLHVRAELGIGADRDAFFDVRRRRIFDRHPGRH